MFLSGPGGIGKSHVIRLIHSDTIKFLKQSGTFEPDDVIVLLTAPTGVAAFNINGMTLHSALLLGTSKYTGFQPLGHDKLNNKIVEISINYYRRSEHGWVKHAFRNSQTIATDQRCISRCNIWQSKHSSSCRLVSMKALKCIMLGSSEHPRSTA